jgi:hypothetical protein
MSAADQSFQNLGKTDDQRPVQLVNEYYRPAGAAARAVRVETDAGPLLVGLDVGGDALWAVPWAYISQATPPAGDAGSWTVRVEQQPGQGATVTTRGPGT